MSSVLIYLDIAHFEVVRALTVLEPLIILLGINFKAIYMAFLVINDRASWIPRRACVVIAVLGLLLRIHARLRDTHWLMVTLELIK